MLFEGCSGPAVHVPEALNETLPLQTASYRLLSRLRGALATPDLLLVSYGARDLCMFFFLGQVVYS